MNKPLTLIIEDDEALSKMLAMIAESVGSATETIADGLEASIRLKKTPYPNLVTLDLHLPKVGGSELLKQIKTNPQLDGTAVVILTADFLSQSVYRPGCEGIQPDELAVTPVDIEILEKMFKKYQNGKSKNDP